MGRFWLVSLMTVRYDFCLSVTIALVLIYCSADCYQDFGLKCSKSIEIICNFTRLKKMFGKRWRNDDARCVETIVFIITLRWRNQFKLNRCWHKRRCAINVIHFPRHIYNKQFVSAVIFTYKAYIFKLILPRSILVTIPWITFGYRHLV